MATAYGVLQIIDRVLAEEAGHYGIKNPAAFADALLGIITSENAGYDPSLRHPTGEWGLFGFHQSGHEIEFRRQYPGREGDIEAQIRYALTYLAPIWADSEARGQSPAEALRRLIAEGQRPAEQYVDQGYQNALAASQQVGRGTIETGGIPYPQGPYTGAVGAAGGQGMAETTGLGFGAWTEQNDPDFPWRDRIRADQPGLIGDAWLKTLSSQERDAKWERYLLATGQGVTGAAAPYERELAGAELTEREAGLGLLPYDIDVQEWENKRKEFGDKITTRELTWKEAADQFWQWAAGAQEARARAEYTHGVYEERAKWTRPEEYHERPAHRATMEMYGLPYTPEKGIAVETLPNPEQMYARFQQNLGISQQAPSMPQMGAVPTAPQAPGAGQARAFLADLLRRHQGQQAATAGLGKAGGRGF